MRWERPSYLEGILRTMYCNIHLVTGTPICPCSRTGYSRFTMTASLLAVMVLGSI